MKDACHWPPSVWIRRRSDDTALRLQELSSRSCIPAKHYSTWLTQSFWNSPIAWKCRLASFPGLPRLRFLIACSVQKLGQKAWWILPRDSRQGSNSQSVSQSSLMSPAKKCSRSSVGPMRLAKSTINHLRAHTEPTRDIYKCIYINIYSTKMTNIVSQAHWN